MLRSAAAMEVAVIEPAHGFYQRRPPKGCLSFGDLVPITEPAGQF